MITKLASGLCVLSLLCLSGCSSQQNANLFAEYPEEMTRFSIVSIAEPGFALPRDSAISFHPSIFNPDDASDPAKAEIKSLLSDVIAQSMKAKGLQFSPYVRARGEFWLAYTLVYESAMSDELMTQRFGMMPGFIKDQNTRYEKGSLILNLVDAQKQMTVWRSSVQGLVAPELDDKLRRIRLRSAIDQMLGSLPRLDS